MTREEIDILWHKAMRLSIEDGDQFTRYRFAELVAEAERNRTWTQDHWTEYERSIAAAAKAEEREACAKVCEEKQEYSMPIPCPDGISGCLVAHYIPARREKTGSECAAAIRARSNT